MAVFDISGFFTVSRFQPHERPGGPFCPPPVLFECLCISFDCAVRVVILRACQSSAAFKDGSCVTDGPFILFHPFRKGIEACPAVPYDSHCAHPRVKAGSARTHGNFIRGFPCHDDLEEVAVSGAEGFPHDPAVFDPALHCLGQIRVLLPNRFQAELHSGKRNDIFLCFVDDPAAGRLFFQAVCSPMPAEMNLRAGEDGFPDGKEQGSAKFLNDVDPQPFRIGNLFSLPHVGMDVIFVQTVGTDTNEYLV